MSKSQRSIPIIASQHAETISCNPALDLFRSIHPKIEEIPANKLIDSTVLSFERLHGALPAHTACRSTVPLKRFLGVMWGKE